MPYAYGFTKEAGHIVVIYDISDMLPKALVMTVVRNGKEEQRFVAALDENGRPHPVLSAGEAELICADGTIVVYRTRH